MINLALAYNFKVLHSENSVLFGRVIPVEYFKKLQPVMVRQKLDKSLAKLKPLQYSEYVIWVSICKPLALGRFKR